MSEGARYEAVRAKLREEAARIRSDFEYAARRYFLIKNRNPNIQNGTGITTLVLNKGQKKILDAILRQQRAGKPVRIIVLKARQFGGSTVIQAWIYWNCITKKHRRALTIGSDKDNAETLQSISRTIHQRMDVRFRPMTRYDNKNELAFDNPDRKPGTSSTGMGSSMVCETSETMADGGDTGAVDVRRGLHADYFHGSELSSWKQGRGLLESIRPAIPNTPETAIFLESTANLEGDFWYQECERARRGESDFEFVFVPWFEHEEYERELPEAGLGALTDDEAALVKDHGVTEKQICWRRWTIKNYFRDNTTAFLREYPEDPETCFTSKGAGIFGHVIEQAKRSQARPLKTGELERVEKAGEDRFEKPEYKFVSSPAGCLRVWEEPQEGALYALGADVAEGLSRDCDFSAIHVVNARGETTATWHGRIRPGAFAGVVEAVARWYNNAFTAIERNGPGLATLERIEDTYGNLYFEALTNGRFGEKTERVGFRTTEQSKTLLITTIERAISEGDGDTQVRDEGLITEMKTFVKKSDGKTGAAEGCNDDKVIAYGIALTALREISQARVLQPLGRGGRRHRDDMPKLHVMGRRVA